ncbi:hypothetical protein ON010_g17511 [Phytophthora cinnamomi]|nr:hypothetical protein ON010_g17511 [Phytophthora cinnamomi]
MEEKRHAHFSGRTLLGAGLRPDAVGPARRPLATHVGSNERIEPLQLGRIGQIGVARRRYYQRSFFEEHGVSSVENYMHRSCRSSVRGRSTVLTTYVTSLMGNGAYSESETPALSGAKPSTVRQSVSRWRARRLLDVVVKSTYQCTVRLSTSLLEKGLSV